MGGWGHIYTHTYTDTDTAWWWWWWQLGVNTCSLCVCVCPIREEHRRPPQPPTSLTDFALTDSLGCWDLWYLWKQGYHSPPAQPNSFLKTAQIYPRCYSLEKLYFFFLLKQYCMPCVCFYHYYHLLNRSFLLLLILTTT